MSTSEMLRDARAAARLSQRELADRTGIAQPTIARIERGLADPRLDTVQRLLAACDARIVIEPLPGAGVDQTQIRELLRLTPRQRVELLRDDAAGMSEFDRAVGR